MYLTSEKKEELFSQYGKSNKDTGSAESQIALFSYRIAHLTEHLKKNHKDFATQRSLIKLVGKRRALLDYLKPGLFISSLLPPKKNSVKIYILTVS